MKGYIEHLIASSEEFSREIEREYKNIEVPYLSEAYKKWMLNKNGKTENVVRSYISYIKSADKEFFTFEEDFFILLPQKIQAGDFAGVSSLFDKYLGIIDEWFETSKLPYFYCRMAYSYNESTFGNTKGCASYCSGCSNL